MPISITNYSNIPLPLAVWLASDDYDHDPRPNSISATGIMKPIKSIVLSKQIDSEINVSQDLQDLIPARVGTALHTAIDEAWKAPNLPDVFRRLGYPNKIVERIRINPPRDDIDEDQINIWMEQRTERELDGFLVTGKFDLVYEFGVEDYKSTGTYNWISGSNDEKYRLQGSIYRWLNPDIIRSDKMKINFIFTDWSALKATVDKNYPKRRIEVRKLELLSISDTEHYLRTRLAELKTYWDKKEADLPACTPEELWQRPSTWAYYKNPNSTTRATKVFDNMNEAEERRIQDGSTGVVVHRPGEVKFCRYCPARIICQQAESYQAQGLLQI
jgi:hypothetical protein